MFEVGTFEQKLHFCIFTQSHLVSLPSLCHNERFQFEQEGSHLLQPVGVFSLTRRGWSSYLYHIFIIHHPIHKQYNDKPGLHDLRPHQGQCRRAAQVSWPAVQGAARVSSPSSLAGSASLAGPPARSPWCSSPRRGTLGRDSRGELDKRRCPGKSKYHIHCVNES